MMPLLFHRELGQEKLDAMYQRTGAPLHASYALPQLRAFYAKEENRHLAERIERWQTLSTICLHRWSGKPCVQMPISYSEASWTGMLDFRTCSWDHEALLLVETCPGVTQYVEPLEEGDEARRGEEGGRSPGRWLEEGDDAIRLPIAAHAHLT